MRIGSVRARTVLDDGLGLPLVAVAARRPLLPLVAVAARRPLLVSWLRVQSSPQWPAGRPGRGELQPLRNVQLSSRPSPAAQHPFQTVWYPSPFRSEVRPHEQGWSGELSRGCAVGRGETEHATRWNRHREAESRAAVAEGR